MVTKKQKEQIVAELVEKFKKASGFYVVNFVGMTVEKTQEFRKVIREGGFEYKVAKNSLILKALAEVENFDIPKEKMFGQSGIVFSYTDPTAPSKLLKKFIKDNEKPEFKVANLEGEVFDETQLEAITKLPTKEDMIAGIIGALSSPISGITRSLDQATGIVGALGAVTRDLAYVIEEVAKKRNAA